MRNAQQKTKNKTILEIKSVTKRFGGLVAVNNLSFYIKRREILGLIGPNGSGKTTLFNVITGDYPADGGRIKFDGEDITNIEPNKVVEKGIGRTFQATRLFFNSPVIWNVMTSQHCRLKEIGENQIQGALELLGLTKLEHIKHKLTKNLTHAEQRRLMIAMAVATGPKLLLLDEPSSGMSTGETDELISIIKRIRDEEGMTILLIEHDMRVAMNISDRIVAINFGEKIAEGTPKKISKNGAVIEAYLGRGRTYA